ncbi:hypothetical protein TrLO_g3474 [Triparma laevis f. longispina]|uniref:Transmembrane protein n=1 Tax=Triparma laevis f. longispina TaxID=1714387 RepID=A0A9W7DNH7_9STRA|nr:hypothetical protein TrLO_g3474 [Triparma laevis f. longispina]
MPRSSVGNTSMRYTYDGSRGQSIETEGPRYRRRVLALGAFLGVLSIVNICMCSYYGYIGTACTNVALSDDQQLPFNLLTSIFNNNYNGLGIKTCEFTDLNFNASIPFPNGYGQANPTATWEACMVESNNAQGKMVSSFPLSMGFLGGQTLVYTWLAFAILYRSLNHYEWLLSTIAFMCYAVLGVVAYYTFNPFLPYPHQTAATVATLTYYIKPDMYDDTFIPYTHHDGTVEKVPMENCDSAYNFNLAFLVVQYMSVSVTVMLLFIAFSAERIRRRYPLVNQLPPLKGTFFPMTICVICLLAYAVMVVSKAQASITSLDIIADKDSPSSVFPFAQGSLDVPTVFLIVTTMSVIRGTTRSSTSAFRLSAVTAILHIALVYPNIVGNYEVTKYNDMWKMGTDPVNLADPSEADGDATAIFGSGCKGFWNTYFLSYYNTAADVDRDVLLADDWIHPTSEQSTTLCYGTWISFIAQATIFVMMHIQVIACSMVYKQNKGRPTDVFDPQPPTAPGHGDDRSEPLLGQANNITVVGRI